MFLGLFFLTIPNVKPEGKSIPNFRPKCKIRDPFSDQTKSKNERSKPFEAGDGNKGYTGEYLLPAYG